jgi:hypothetical protein
MAEKEMQLPAGIVTGQKNLFYRTGLILVRYFYN